MIFSENTKSDLNEFKLLMKKTDIFLNEWARHEETYFRKRNSQILETDVYEALCKNAKGSVFENSIQLVSGKKFPDIVALNCYGVEVKSTEKDHWTSTGSSILESTRIQSVERIYMTFGKLGGTPVEFLSRPYEEVLCDIAVTHSPRYKIDMRLSQGESVFDKMGIPYDELRTSENQFAKVSEHLKKKLKPGESLWWASSGDSPYKLRLWNLISPEEKRNFIAQGLAFFPEILNGHYERFLFHLLQRHSVLNHCIRDSFSAGGKFNGFPAVFKRIYENFDLIKFHIENTSNFELCEYWKIHIIEKDRIAQWKKLLAQKCTLSKQFFQLSKPPIAEWDSTAI